MKLKIILILMLFVSCTYAQESEDWPEETLDTNAFTGFFIQIKAAPMFTHNMFTKTIVEGFDDAISPNTFYTENATLLTDVTFGYKKSEWALISGLQYYSYTEQFELTEKKEVYTDADTILLDLTTKANNSYQMLSLKLGGAYVVNMNCWQLDILAGVHLGFSLNKKGLTYDYKTKEIISLKDNYQPIQISYSLSATLKYKWTDKINIFVEPYYMSGINSVWKSSPVYAWKRIQYGAFIGVEYLIQ